MLLVSEICQPFETADEDEGGPWVFFLLCSLFWGAEGWVLKKGYCTLSDGRKMDNCKIWIWPDVWAKVWTTHCWISSFWVCRLKIFCRWRTIFHDPLELADPGGAELVRKRGWLKSKEKSVRQGDRGHPIMQHFPQFEGTPPTVRVRLQKAFLLDFLRMPFRSRSGAQQWNRATPEDQGPAGNLCSKTMRDVSEVFLLHKVSLFQESSYFFKL